MNNSLTLLSCYLVLRCSAKTKEQMDQLQLMSEDVNLNLDFWMEPRKSSGDVDIMTTTTSQRVMIEDKLNDIGVSCRVMINNVQELIDLERMRYEKSLKNVGMFCCFIEC